MTQMLDKSDYIIDIFQLIESFSQNFKKKADFKTGVEFEKLGVSSENFQAINYYGDAGSQEFLRRLRPLDDYKESLEGNNILGLNGPFGHITLEPGNQFEYSTKPFKNLKDVEMAYSSFNKRTGIIAEELNITWIGSGIQPLSTFESIQMIPKKRYEIMRRYLPMKGKNAPVMMMETAGTQASFDYESEEDAMRKLRVSIGISPVITGMFCNSPIREGKLSGYKSYRAMGWLNTDDDRCGLISRKVFEGSFNFADYVEILLDVPMFFIERDGQLIDMTGITFREYLKNGYQGFRATMSDWFLHNSTFFPDVRLKEYLEIRNCDCQRGDTALAFPALLKGIMYNEDALEQAEEILRAINWMELQEIRHEVPRQGLDSKFGRFNMAEIAQELVSIAEYSLKSMSKEHDETIYVKKLKELVSEAKTPADIIIKNWDSGWGQDIRKFIKYAELH